MLAQPGKDRLSLVGPELVVTGGHEVGLTGNPHECLWLKGPQGSVKPGFSFCRQRNQVQRSKLTF